MLTGKISLYFLPEFDEENINVYILCKIYKLIFYVVDQPLVSLFSVFLFT